MSDTSLIIGCQNIYIPTQIKYIFIFALSNVLLRKGHIISGKKIQNNYLYQLLPCFNSSTESRSPCSLFLRGDPPFCSKLCLVIGGRLVFSPLLTISTLKSSSLAPIIEMSEKIWSPNLWSRTCDLHTKQTNWKWKSLLKD
jgi:hypothetical protein